MKTEWLTKELADSLFYYKDGSLYWKVDRASNKVKDTKVGSITKSGYFESKLDGKPFKTHRVVFLIHHGYLPVMVDHINGVRSDNRIENLRAATPSQNKINQITYKNNTSGVKGVYLKNNKWSAQINYDNKRRYLGAFDTIELASEFADLARQMVHQDFARTA
jgi:hypothetical protein